MRSTRAPTDIGNIRRLAEHTAENGSFSSDEDRLSHSASLSLYSASDDDGEGDPSDDRTVMALFQSYYRTSDGKQDTQSMQESNLDSASFNADEYAKMQLQSKDVTALLDHDASMLQEIKTLDSDMQMLVYENYNKFISATETIRRMKVNVETMETDMTQLQTSMKDVSGNSDALESSLQDKRTKIDKLVCVKRLLRRLDFLCELPQRLQSMIEAERYEAAVSLYQKTSIVLKKHAHVLSFRRIQEETEQMIMNLRGTVSKKLEAPNVDATTLSNYAGILLSMRAPPAELLSKFIGVHNQRCMRILGHYQKAIEASLSATEERTTFLTIVQKQFVSDLLEAIAGIAKHFVPLIQLSAEEKCARVTLQQEHIFAHLKSLMELVGEPYVKLLGRMAEVFCALMSEPASDDMALQLSVLRQSVADMCTVELEAQNSVGSGNRAFPDIGKRCGKAVQAIIAGQCDLQTKVARTDALSRLLGASEESKRLTDAGSEGVPNVKAILQDRIALAGELYASLQQDTFLSLGTCLKSIQPLLQLQETLLIQEKHGSLASPSHRARFTQDLGPSDVFALGFVDRLCSEIERAMGIPARFDEGDNSLRSVQDIEMQLYCYTGKSYSKETALCLLLAYATKCMSEGISDLNSITDGQIGRSSLEGMEDRLRETSFRLLLQYTERKACDLTRIAEGMFEQTETPYGPPSKVSESATRLCIGLDAAMLECSVLLLEAPPTKPVGNSARVRDHDYRRNLTHGGVLRFDLDRLFSQKVTTFTVPTLETVWNIETVLGGVIRGTFKSTTEYARLKYFSMSVYQHVQLDLAFLRQVMPFLLQDTNVAEERIEQVMIAVADRTMDGTTPGLDGSTLAGIVGKEQGRIVESCFMQKR